VFVARRAVDGGTMVTVLPITHSAPDNPDWAIEIPAAVKRNLGLDDLRSWIVVGEGNQFLWPGFHLRSAGNSRMARGRHPRPGDVYWIDPNPVAGREMKDRHRFVVITLTAINALGVAMTVPVTTGGAFARNRGTDGPNLWPRHHGCRRMQSSAYVRHRCTDAGRFGALHRDAGRRDHR
jgi:hypothetical protein